ncbi:MAG TPA: MraY family glycosyltransferase [Alphaproteobacteria bacterium]
MIFAVLAKHVLFGGVLALISAGLTWLMLRVRIMDVPNQRSSHARPVPNGGGVAIVATFFIGYAALYVLGNTGLAAAHMAGFALAALGISAVSFYDDLGRIPTFALKLIAQVLAASILVAFGIVFRSWSLPWVGAIELGVWGYPLTVLWVVALTNIVNFMDGLDGLAGGACAIAALFLGFVTSIEGSLFVYLFCYVIAAATLGFLVFNFPRARIFMGDVGSQFLGFVFAALAVIAAEHDASRTSFLVVPLLFFHFIFDTAFTMVRRALRGEDITQAHRSHLYQLLNQCGWSHAQVSALHFAMTALQGAAVLWLIRLGPDRRALVFLPFLALEIVYAFLVMRAAKRRGLLS